MRQQLQPTTMCLRLQVFVGSSVRTNGHGQPPLKYQDLFTAMLKPKAALTTLIRYQYCPAAYLSHCGQCSIVCN